MKAKEFVLANSGYSFNEFHSKKAIQIYLAEAEPREKRIAELEAQIEKMKNCKNCANYMISGKCPCFLERVGAKIGK